MNLFWIVTVTAISVCVGSFACFYLLTQVREVDSTVWILEHIVCPIFKIIVLMIMVSLVYPFMTDSSSVLDFWNVLGQQGQFNDLLNILFFAGLLMAFLPLVSHPVIALPSQSLLTIALVFKWEHEAIAETLSLLPSVLTVAKIVVYMILVYFFTREASIHVSRWIDKKTGVSGSIRLVSDAIYLELQIPVMLIYISWLKLQISG